jgi:hypothetical protein
MDTHRFVEIRDPRVWLFFGEGVCALWPRRPHRRFAVARPKVAAIPVRPRLTATMLPVSRGRLQHGRRLKGRCGRGRRRWCVLERTVSLPPARREAKLAALGAEARPRRCPFRGPVVTTRFAMTFVVTAPRSGREQEDAGAQKSAAQPQTVTQEGSLVGTWPYS